MSATINQTPEGSQPPDVPHSPNAAPSDSKASDAPLTPAGSPGTPKTPNVAEDEWPTDLPPPPYPLWMLKGVGKTLWWLVHATGTRTEPPDDAFSQPPFPTLSPFQRPMFDTTGERIIYDADGHRLPALFHREFTRWDRVRSFATIPFMLPAIVWRAFLWGYDGMRPDAPDLSWIRPSGPLVPEVAAWIAEQDAEVAAATRRRDGAVEQVLVDHKDGVTGE